MAPPRATTSGCGRIAPTPPGTGAIDGVQARVTATVMLDVLVAVKMDLMKRPPSGIGCAEDLQSRVDRASVTIEAAIDDLKRVAGISGTRDDDTPALLNRGFNVPPRKSI